MNHKLSYTSIILTVCLLFFAGRALSGSELSPSEIALKMQQTYEETRTIKADFHQKASVTGMPDRQRIGRGKVKIKKPGMVRWDYEVPETQVLVSDGKNFSLYLKEENQMIVTPSEQYLGDDVIYSFFNGSGNILEDFETEPVPDNMCSDDTYCLQLTPKESHPQVETLYIWCNKDTFMIERLRIVDPLGGFTDITFSNIEVNQPVSNTSFSFSPPPGTEIITQ